MELLRLLLEDFKKEKENKRYRKRMEMNFPVGQKLRITEEKTDADEGGSQGQENIAAEKMCSENDQDSSENEENQEEIKTMQQYDQSGRLDIESWKLAQEEHMEESFCEASAYCRHYQMKCEREGNCLYITTDVGKWYFYPKEGSITLYHKNYELRRNQAETYHIQFTRECGIREILWYIYKHDQKQKRRMHRN